MRSWRKRGGKRTVDGEDAKTAKSAADREEFVLVLFFFSPLLATILNVCSCPRLSVKKR